MHYELAALSSLLSSILEKPLSLRGVLFHLAILGYMCPISLLQLTTLGEHI